MALKICDCKEWNDFGHSISYTGTGIRYCPWCGKGLSERK